MVTWSADGTIAGYDPVTKRLKKGLLHFSASGPASVDLGGITRLNTAMGAGLNLSTFPNSPQAQASFAYTAADFAANPGKVGLSAGLIIIRADKFPAGHKPTPQEMWDKAASGTFDLAQRASTYVFGPGGITHTFDFVMANSEFYWNTKWWILLYPSALTKTNVTWSKTNDSPVKGTSLNTVGRVISFWSERTPLQPTITSPVSGSVVLPGAEFTLRLNPNDPDEMAPEDTAKYNDDVNGVEFQYRPMPTPAAPSPEWKGLPFDTQVTYEGDILKFRAQMWHIRGSRYWNGLPGTSYHEALVANLGCTVVAGAGALTSDYQSGKGALPSGDWQIRGRTFDYGHPYPNSGTKTNEPGPLGINPATTFLKEPLNEYYPEQNRSPWSEPINVSIPSQVPPPVAIYPKDDIAVSGNLDSVRLKWQYRNTHQPPRPQYLRSVEIRKVGDLTWSRVFAGPGSDPYVDLPMSLTQTPLSPLNVAVDGTYEGGTIAGLVNGNSVMSTTVINKNDATKAHSGNRYLELRNPTTTRPNRYAEDFSVWTPITYVPGADGIKDIPFEYTDFEFDTWFWIDASVYPITLALTIVWVDGNGDIIVNAADPTNKPYGGAYAVSFISKKFSGPAQWRRLSDLIPDMDLSDYYAGPDGYYGDNPGRRTFQRPVDGQGLIWLIEAGYNDHSEPPTRPLLPEMRLDDTTITATGPSVQDFTMSATNEYEWQVSVTDTDGVGSQPSVPARFWLVPGGASGEVSPVPSETIDGATLGCGTHRVFVYRRGGKERVGELTGLSHVDWSRVRDDISTAQITVSGWDFDCGNLLAHLQTWAYELVIYRDNGFSVDRVWEGPITLLTYENDKVTIDAKDVMGYAYRRIIKQKMTDSGKGNGTTVTDRARRIIQNVFAPDDPNILAYLQVLSQPDDAMQYRSTPAWSRTAYEEIDDMAANSGLDYTSVGRAILLWGTKHRIGTLPELRDEDLGASPIVSEYGMSTATVYSVSDGNGVHGEATRGLDPVSGNNADYGLVEMLSSTWASDSEDDSGTYTQAGLATVIESFKTFAERSISDRFPPPVVVRVPDNTSLNPDTPLSIQHLVPGVVIPLRSVSTLRSVYATQKLDSVKVVEESGKETVSITLSPFSRDDAAIGETEADA